MQGKHVLLILLFLGATADEQWAVIQYLKSFSERFLTDLFRKTGTYGKETSFG